MPPLLDNEGQGPGGVSHPLSHEGGRGALPVENTKILSYELKYWTINWNTVIWIEILKDQFKYCHMNWNIARWIEKL